MIYYKYEGILHPLQNNSGRINFTVDKGKKIDKVIDDLEGHNVIEGNSLLKWYLNRNYADISAKAGYYSFSSDIPLNSFVEYLKNGIKDDRPVTVTIPEGYDIEHVAVELDRKGIISKEKFLSSCKKYKYPEFIIVDKRRRYALEGYLFPDTYKFLKGTSGDIIIKTMLNRFSQVISEIEKKNNKKFSNMELDRIVTMASIVEKEVKRPDERAKAASVFYNRLRKKMKLQSCATVLYALDVHKDKLYYKDLKVKSPFNTYIVEGLPAGPISNPGRGCIESAIKPDNTNYLYFVSKNDGTHFFTDDEKNFLKVKKLTQGD
ncbi:endolytic transglycosylase MltG [Clostridium sp. LBM24168]